MYHGIVGRQWYPIVKEYLPVSLGVLLLFKSRDAYSNIFLLSGINTSLIYMLCINTEHKPTPNATSLTYTFSS